MSQLQVLVSKAGIHLKMEPEAKIMPVPEASKPLPPPPEPDKSDDEVFAEAMGGVHRIPWKKQVHPAEPAGRPPAQDPELENQRLMQAALDADSPMEILDHPEYIEGWVGVAGKKFLPNLRNGLYSIQGQIDLHGLSRVEAQTAVEEYIVRMSRFRSCCVKIIHGRGINSPIDRATLKESLQRLLSTRRMSRYVVAYASALSRDGGVGAVYVLLSRQ
jgi:DNA-nicking Smr family endonuclease